MFLIHLQFHNVGLWSLQLLTKRIPEYGTNQIMSIRGTKLPTLLPVLPYFQACLRLRGELAYYPKEQ